MRKDPRHPFEIKEDQAKNSVRNVAIGGIALLLAYVAAVENGCFDKVPIVKTGAQLGKVIFEPFLNLFL